MADPEKLKVVVLGGSGMLGSMITDVLARDSSLRISATLRDASLVGWATDSLDSVEWKQLDVVRSSDEELIQVLGHADWIINAVGVIKPYVRDQNAIETERALSVNAVFPHRLARAAARINARVLQIATDCVYSGRVGGYGECSPHDPLDVYGKTKSLGEVVAPNVCHLRCSIVGPEVRNGLSLLEWFLERPRGAILHGYTNHHWNGMTTLHFARVCRGIVRSSLSLPRLQHIVPADQAMKCELLRLFRTAYERTDIQIIPEEAPQRIDRTLATENRDLNEAIWAAEGYRQPPTIAGMVNELARFDFRMAGPKGLQNAGRGLARGTL
jgi:dTDP-4-dehydrorhamnose reductase